MSASFTRLAVATAASLASFALVAGAANASSTTTDPVKVTADRPADPDAQNVKKRYCVSQQVVTGSFVSRKICKTRAQWLKDGVDPTATPTK